jgi:uncharacterized protein (TIGR00251 family)
VYLQRDRISAVVKEKLQTKIVTQVQPNARQNEVTGFKDGVLHVKIAAPPVGGKANQELIKFLSAIWGVSKSSLTIEKGVTSRRKLIGVTGLTLDQVLERSRRK